MQRVFFQTRHFPKPFCFNSQICSGANSDHCSANMEARHWNEKSQKPQHDQKTLPNMVIEGNLEDEEHPILELVRRHGLRPNGRMVFQLERILREETIAAALYPNDNSFHPVLSSQPSSHRSMPTIHQETEQHNAKGTGKGCWPFKLPNFMKAKVWHWTSRGRVKAKGIYELETP